MRAVEIYNTLPVPYLHIYQLLLLVHKFLFHKHKLPEVFIEYGGITGSRLRWSILT